MKKLIYFVVAVLIFISSVYGQDDKLKGSILDANVNGDFEDYNAFIIFGKTTDTLFFTSSRSVPNRRPIAISAEMFFSTRPAKDRLNNKPINEGWSKAQQIKIQASRIAKFTRGSQTIGSDRIIFAAERDMSTIDATGSSYLFDLWQMTRTKDGFGSPKPIEAVNDPDAWDSQPALSLDGKVLVFTSNRKNGKGGLDLWYSVMSKNGEWSSPKLVPNINTPGNEVSPHFGSDGKFYFASDWDYINNKKGSNKKDIFRADFKNYNGIQLPINPINLDVAIKKDAEKFDIDIPVDMKFNSSANDEFPFISPDRKAIFITSNRKAKFDKRNIYAFSLPKSKIRILVNVYEKILDSKGNLLIPNTKKTGLELNLTDKNTGNTTIMKSGIAHEVEANKTYNVKINKFVEEECYQDKIEGGEVLTINVPKPFGLDTLIVREMHITRQKVEIPPIIFHSTDTLPYFITGYWYPNTTENLQEFRRRESNGFFNSTGFVDSTGYNYDSTSKIIDNNFYAQIYKPLIEKLPAFQDFCRDTLYLKITIHGYTDPRGLSAGENHPYREASRNKRNYPDETVTVGLDARNQPVTITTGLDMWKPGWPIDPSNRNGKWIKLQDEGQNGNILLSKLRAYFTFKTFDKKMQQLSPIYKQMRNEGRIILDAEGFGIDKKGFKKRGLRDDPQSRRIEIYIDVLRPEELKYHKRIAGGTLKREMTYQVNKTNQNIQVEEKQEFKAPKVETEVKPEIKPKVEEIKKPTQEIKPATKEIKVEKKIVMAPLEPEKEIPNPEPYTKVNKICYTIQFASYSTQENAKKALQTLKEGGLRDAQIENLIDSFGNPVYKLRYGCFKTAEDAVLEMKNLRWVNAKLNIKKKPVIIKESK